ncbi:hypothetical protein RRG08_010175 [Elysia crispata]|uniref:Uncharacterized protein n=1 Tax=Elysia crispata TaxID=231223 RepID=A0AAE1DZN7_9GAST|nr:hypothetical protein RRG08_010175 [Elysia crispata]
MNGEKLKKSCPWTFLTEVKRPPLPPTSDFSRLEICPSTAAVLAVSPSPEKLASYTGTLDTKHCRRTSDDILQIPSALRMT